MNQKFAIPVCSLTAFAFALGFATTAPAAQNHERQIRESINDANRVTLAGNTHPDAIPANDRGILRDEEPMNGLQLVLHRSPEAEAAFEQYISELHNPKSAFFHKWLTNKQIGDRFGASDEDLDTVKEWLSSKGLHVSNIAPDRMSIEFSGDAGHVREAFQAPIHNLMVNGKAHFSNVNDPTMPRGLSPVVEGVAKLNDFMPHGMSTRRPDVQPKGGQGSAGTPFNFIGAADLATVYNFNPLYAAGITGKGQTIVVVEDTNQFSAADFLSFRKVMGLSRTYPFGTLTQVNPAGTANACGNPGDNGDDTEAALDVDWASAAAPNASIVSAACADTAQFGGFLALANLLTEANPPKIVSISYGESETLLGATENLYINNLYQSAVGEGVTIFVSSGDEGADSTDANRTNATHGISVSGFTSTPYNVSVGGTDFAAFPFGEYNTYFNATNLANFRTALSYIPEVPWDDSCAGGIFAAFEGFPTSGANSLCNEFGQADGLLSTGAGSGGPSGCATGASKNRGVANGTCVGYPKPAWQKLVGVPADGVRDIPDVSLMASNGFWGEYYAACISNPADGPAAAGFTPCGPNPATWTGWGGTSISSPIWAGIQALVNQSTGEAWGNANPVLYSLANTEYGAGGNSSCNSSLGNGVGPTCMFYDVTQGDIVINCTGTFNCYINGGTFGILSTSDTAPNGAYPATTGWDFATGIGTTNAANLVNGWKAASATTKPVLLDRMKK
jgi:subtilase family serine protease